MKQKILYILVLICCISAISSARETGKICSNYACCHPKQSKAASARLVKAGYDLSPLEFFIFNI